MRENTVIASKKPDVVRIDIDLPSSERQDVLFLSDIHIDSIHCDRALLRRNLEEAVKRQAIVMIAGDLFDAMQGRNDPRQSPRELKLALLGDDYFDRVLQDGVDFFKPYAASLALVGYGNHEYSVMRHNGTDLIQRFVYAMRREGSPVVAGGYGGFVRFAIHIPAMVNRKTATSSFWMYYNHGSGGDAPVTHGSIGNARQAAWLENCDIVWNGHNHKSYVMTQSILAPTTRGEIAQRVLFFLRTPGYKNELANPAHGFAASRNMAPTPRGCIWGQFWQYNAVPRMAFTQDVE